MNMIVNAVMRLCGLGKAVDALNGEASKTYLGAVVVILTGAATLLGGVAGIAGQVIAASTGADYLALAQGIGHNASAGLVMAGAAGIGKGIAIIGQRHAQANADAVVAAAPVAVVPTAPVAVVLEP